MRATRLSVANYNTTLSSDSLETGTGSSNSLRSANESLRTDSRPNEAKSFCDLSRRPSFWRPQARGLAQLAQGLGLDLPNPFARHRELLADFLQRVLGL
jgi:hypothetical protein